MTTPVVADYRVVPVAGRDSMLLNLSGAHGPFFTRNLVILTDSDGRTGVGEVPGGPAITDTLTAARDLVVGARLGDTTGSWPWCGTGSAHTTRQVAARRPTTCG